MRIPIQIEVDKTSILGVIHIPSKINTTPKIIIFCYGLNGNRVDNNRIGVKLSEYAEKNGIIVIRFDYRGLGISEGDFFDVNFESKIRDVLEVYSFVKGCMCNTPHQVYLLGFSDGCRVVSKVINKIDDSNMAGLVFWSPLFYADVKYVEKDKKKKFIRDYYTKKIGFPYKGLVINPNHLRQIQNYQDEYKMIEKYDTHKLFIFGTEDTATIQIYETIRTNKTDTQEEQYIQDADHLYSREEWSDEVIKATIDWINNI